MRRNVIPDIFYLIKINSISRLQIIAGIVLLCVFSCLHVANAQSGDQSNVRFTQGQVNDGAAVSLSVPLSNYPGRGINLPVGLSYSSSVWRIDHIVSVKNYSVAPPYYIKQSVTQALYAEHSKSGWKSGLDLPQIEWPKLDEIYDYKGRPATCCYDYRIAHVTIHMPDGSSHEFRKSDQFYNSGSVDMTGTFYAVDGSRMRFDSTGVDTGTLFMPDGSRYVLGHPTSQLVDKLGNALNYDETTRQWTDTLGRIISNPIPANPQAQDYTYTLPGLTGVNGGVLTYTLRWKNLANALTPDQYNNVPPLRYVASHYLPNPAAVPSDSNGANFPQVQSNTYGNLFYSATLPDEDPGNPNPNPLPTLVVGNGQAAGQLFNPVVLAEIILPDGTSYKFSYDVYGEIDKVVYPTGAYEKYSFDPMISGLDEFKQPYVQTSRKISSHRQSINGTGSDEIVTTFQQVLVGSYRKTTIVAPDSTRTEIFKLEIPEPADTTGKQYWPFGIATSANGMVVEKRAYASTASGGQLLRRELNQYDESIYTYTYTAQGINPPYSKTVSAYRNPRPTKSVTLLFEGTGPALAQTTTFSYDTSNQFTTGIDQTASYLYSYAVVSNSSETDTAQAGSISTIPTGSLAKYSETIFNSDSALRNANILGVPSVAMIKNAAGTIVSQSEMVYDECPTFCTTAGKALPTSMRTWDSTKGLVTNPSAFLVTHAKFDQWGNRIEATDAVGNTTVTTYDPTNHAYPISVTSNIPDPNPSQNPDGLPHGSQSAFVSSTSFDTVTGLVLSTTDANGQISTMEYNDPLLRPTKAVAPNGHQTINEYGAGTSDATRWVKVRTQIDAEKWSEAISKYDGLGRTYLTEKIDAQGSIFTETEYDIMGRVKKTSNPYRAADVKQWTTPEYDDLSRTKKVTSPDSDDVQIVYGLSTTSVIGTTKTITDQAGRERTGITDALGNMVRVYEGPVAQNLSTDYVFDTLGNLRKTIQGEQSRYFMYDSLGRVLFAKQLEQDTNTAFAATDPITGNNQWSVKYLYDDNANITTTTDARNVSITGTYDHFNRLIKRDYSDSTPDVSFFYDGTGLGTVPNFSKGKTTKVTSSVSETRNTAFDSMGRLTASQQITDEQTYPFTYVYNLSGALIEETYPSTRVVKNTLNADGELSQVQSKKNANSGYWTYADNFTYNASGAVTKMQLGNGHWETAEYDDKRLQVKMIGLGTTSGDQNLLRLDFEYTGPSPSTNIADRNNGGMRKQTITVPTVGSNQTFTATQTYTYDSLNRIQSATETIGGTQTWKQTFSIDRYGNRRFDAANTTTLGSCSAAVCNPDIGTDRNRLSSAQGYSYDQNGALTQDASGQRFGYDAESHQKEFFSASNQTTTPDASYFYDGEGKRIKKIVGTEVTIFVYDASGQLAAEYSTTVVPQAQAKTSYLTTDHLGSPRIITDQNGAVISRKDFAAFGDEIFTPQRTGGPSGNGYDPPNIRQDYTGYQKDGESSLEYAEARYYNSGHGRFTTVDPLTASAVTRNPQTFNRYSYVLNSPYESTDPLGLMTQGPRNQGGGCSAEFSNCSDGGSFGLYYITSRTTTYTATSNQGSNSATITVTVTELWVEDSKGNASLYDPKNEVAATLSNVRGYSSLEQEQIKTIAEAATRAAIDAGIDVGRFLGLVQGESEFGMVKTGEGAIKNGLSNPTQLSGGRAKTAAWGSPGYAAALKYNLEQSIKQVYNWAEGKSGGNLQNFLYYWNGNRKIERNGQEQRVNFANRVLPIINGIKATMTVSAPQRRGYFESLGSPGSVPTAGVRPCNIFICGG